MRILSERYSRRLWALALLLLLGWYLRGLAPAVSPYAGGSDSSGYLWSARLFRHGTLSVPIEVPRDFPIERTGTSVFEPLGAKFRPGTATLVPTYPTGLPLHLAAAGFFLGEEAAAKTVLLLSAAGTLWLLFLVGREAGLPRLWAATGSTILALSPLFLFIAVQPFSDVLATLWAQAAVLCAWRSRQRRAFAWLAGGALGIATLVRPTNLVMALPVVAAMPLAGGWYLRLIGGGLPFAIFVAAYQAWAYGNPFTSGYGDPTVLFVWRAVRQSLRHYLVWGPRLASWVVVFVPAAWWAWRGPLARWRIIAAAWLLAIFGTYAFYQITSETWWYMRFVLPAFPMLIVAGLAGLRAATERLRSRLSHPGAKYAASAVTALFVGVCLAAVVQSPLFNMYRTVKASERVYKDVFRVIAMDERPPRLILMMQTSGAANYYQPNLRFLRYDFLPPGTWGAIRSWQHREGLTIGAALFGFEPERAFGKQGDQLPCNWQSRGHYLTVQFWECPP